MWTSTIFQMYCVPSTEYQIQCSMKTVIFNAEHIFSRNFVGNVLCPWIICIFLNWRIIALQYCNFFPQQRELAIGIRVSPPSWTPLPPPSPPYPSRLSQCTGFGFCASYIKLPLVIYFVYCMYFGHLMQRDDSQEKTLILGKTEGKWEEDGRGWDG